MRKDFPEKNLLQLYINVVVYKRSGNESSESNDFFIFFNAVFAKWTYDYVINRLTIVSYFLRRTN